MYETGEDELRDKMRLKFIETLQTPPKDSEVSYGEETLNTAVKIACDIETALFKKYPTPQARTETFKSLMFKLTSKYTHIKVDILTDDITPQRLLEMSSDDFLSQDEKRKKEEDDENYMNSMRSDFYRN